MASEVRIEAEAVPDSVASRDEGVPADNTLEDGRATGRLERLLLTILASVQFTSIVDFMVVMPLGPQLRRKPDDGRRKCCGGLLVVQQRGTHPRCCVEDANVITAARDKPSVIGTEDK